VSEVDTGLEEFFERGLRHAVVLRVGLETSPVFNATLTAPDGAAPRESSDRLRDGRRRKDGS
jgi:hypothetical protein